MPFLVFGLVAYIYNKSFRTFVFRCNNGGLEGSSRLYWRVAGQVVLCNKGYDMIGSLADEKGGA